MPYFDADCEKECEKECDRLKAINAELVTALENIQAQTKADHATQSGSLQTMRNIVNRVDQIARAALAKARP